MITEKAAIQNWAETLEKEFDNAELSETLDEYVYGISSKIASETNNRGTFSQLRYIFQYMDSRQLLRELRESVRGKDK